MEGKFLPREASRSGHAWLLREAVLHGRDQSHVLSHADGEFAPAMGEDCSRRISVRAEGQPADHTYSAAARLREHAKALSGSGECAPRRRPSRPDPGATAAHVQV